MEDNLIISFTFDGLDIVGVIGNEVYLRGSAYREDSVEECVLVVSRKLLHSALDNFVNNKAEYCERYGHFCGVMGSLRATAWQKVGVNKRCKMILQESLNNEECPTPTTVPTFIVTAFDAHTDMEHG